MKCPYCKTNTTSNKCPNCKAEIPVRKEEVKTEGKKIFSKKERE